MYVLVGQVLNARGRFGPMMWAPIANNVISVAMLVAYLLAFGAATVAQTGGALHRRQEAAARPRLHARHRRAARVSCPTCGPPGFTYRPRFDFRDPG